MPRPIRTARSAGARDRADARQRLHARGVAWPSSSSSATARRLDRLLPATSTARLRSLRDALGLGPDETAERVCEKIVDRKSACRRRAPAGRRCSVAAARTMMRAAERLASYVEATDLDKRARALIDFLIKDDGDPRSDSSVATQVIRRQWPQLDTLLPEEASGLPSSLDRLKVAELLESSAAMLRLADAAIAEYAAAEAAARRARFRGPDRQDRGAAVARRRRALGAIQARSRPRPHPRRRGAGHQPAPVAGDPRAGRGVLRRRRRQRRVAHAVRGRRREAVDLSPSRARCRRGSRAMQRELGGRRAAGGYALERPRTAPLLPLGAGGAGGGGRGLRRPGGASRA